MLTFGTETAKDVIWISNNNCKSEFSYSVFIEKHYITPTFKNLHENKVSEINCPLFLRKHRQRLQVRGRVGRDLS